MTKVIIQLASISRRMSISSKHCVVYHCSSHALNYNENFVRILTCYQISKCLLFTQLQRFLSLLLIQKHFGSTQLYSVHPKACRSTAYPLIEGIFGAVHLSRVTGVKDNDNTIGLVVQHRFNLQQSWNFFCKKGMLLENHGK